MKFFNMYKVEQRLFFRSPDVIIFNLAMPSFFLYAFSYELENYSANAIYELFKD